MKSFLYVYDVMIDNPLNKTDMIRGVSKMKNGGLRYFNVRIDEIPTEKFPTMVMVSKGPAKLRSVIGKKFISLEKAVLAVDEAMVEAMVNREKWNAVKEINFSGIRAFDEI